VTHLVSLGFTRFHLDSLGRTWSLLVSLISTWLHLVPLCLVWFHLVSSGLTWYHSVSLGFTRFRLVLFGFIWFHLDSLAPTWTHLLPLGLTWSHLVSQGKGKTSRSQKEKGRVQTHIFVRFPPYNQTTRTHARTNETKRFPGWTHPETCDVTHMVLLNLFRQQYGSRRPWGPGVASVLTAVGLTYHRRDGRQKGPKTPSCHY